jgi:thiol-disulfide isomerase/thioredoxin
MEVLQLFSVLFGLFFFGTTSVVQPPLESFSEETPVQLEQIPLSQEPVVVDQPVNVEIFAQCLAKKGAVMYGAYWCPHCQSQKKLFGDKFQFITYQECDAKGPNGSPQICKSQGITGYPTWKFPNHPDLVGEQTFAALAAAANCPLN